MISVATIEPVDAYLAWAQGTNFRDYGAAPTDVAVLIECKQTVAALLAATKGKSWIQIAPVFACTGTTQDLAGALTFCTAVVKRSKLALLATLVKRFDLGLAMETAAQGVPTVAATTLTHTNVAAVIDDFVAFAHHDFCHVTGANGLQSRFAHVWSQDSKAPQTAAPSLWRQPKDLAYGYVLAPSELGAAALAQYPLRKRNQSHGTHVTSLLAGKTNHNADLAERAGKIGQQSRSDAAANCPLIGVFLPTMTRNDTSGSSMGVQMVNALHFILNRVRTDATLTVNVSYATFAGAHDGTSILESAVDELLRLRAGRLHVVLPSGNHYESKCHAAFGLAPVNPAKTLLWQVLPDDKSPSFLEIWLPPNAPGKVKVTVTPPSGQPSPPVGCGHQWFAPGTHAWAVIFPAVPANAIRPGGLILVALAATTARPHGAPTVPHGIWRVTVTLDSGLAIDGIEAWIERDDTLPDSRPRGQQSFFVDAAYERTDRRPGQPGEPRRTAPNGSYIQRGGSNNGLIATTEVVTVSGYVGKTFEPAKYSGGGAPTVATVNWPIAASICEANRTLRGLRGPKTTASGVFRMNGTSTAAPLVARRIINWFAAAPAASGPALSFTDVWFNLAHEAAASHAERDAAGLAPPSSGVPPFLAHRLGVGRLDP